MTTPSTTLGEVFTAEQLARAREIVGKYAGQTVMRHCIEHLTEEITSPALGQINQRTGQDNDPSYWAWMLLYAIRHKGGGMSVKEQKESSGVTMITLRVPPWLHEACKEAAHDNRVSMNEYCLQILSQAVNKGAKDVARIAAAKSA
jgi:hypothetical protein